MLDDSFGHAAIFLLFPFSVLLKVFRDFLCPISLSVQAEMVYQPPRAVTGNGTLEEISNRFYRIGLDAVRNSS